MSDFLSRLTAEDKPEAREVTIDGETGTVWFRRLSAGQREQLLKGMKMIHVPGTQGTVEIDFGENEHQRQLMVMYSVCDESGKRHFKDINAVRSVPSYRIKALYKHAEEVNKADEEEDEDLGKS